MTLNKKWGKIRKLWLASLSLFLVAQYPGIADDKLLPPLTRTHVRSPHGGNKDGKKRKNSLLGQE